MGTLIFSEILCGIDDIYLSFCYIREVKQKQIPNANVVQTVMNDDFDTTTASMF